MKYAIIVITFVAALLVACAPVAEPQIPADPVDDTPTTPPFPPVNPGQSGASGTVPAGSLQEQCENFGGTFIAEYDECEGIDDVSCTELGGMFNECASACRHEEPGADRVCTMQCVQVCTLPN